MFQPSGIVAKRVMRLRAIREPEKLRQNTHGTHVRTVSPTSCLDAAGRVHVVMETFIDLSERPPLVVVLPAVA